MFSKKSLFLLLLLVVGGGIFYAVQSSSTRKLPGTRYERILVLVGEMLEEGHFSPKKIDDKFSKEVFNKFLKSLDPDKDYFLASDYEQFKKFETKIDDEIHGAKLESFYVINEIYKKRVDEASNLYKEILKTPFDFNADENYVDDFDKLTYAKNEAARRELWRKKLKYETLSRYSDAMDVQEKSKGKDGFAAKSEEELKKEAREKVVKVYDRMFDRFRNRFKDDDRFSLMVNDITENMDPHTTYFPPVEKRSFDESMSGGFYGIGASLTEDESFNIKVATIVTGGPAQKSGEIQVGDFVLKVAQGSDAPQDLAGFEVPDAVRLIRGKKGTEVRLTIRKPDGSIKVVTMIREKINLEETFAKSSVITSTDNSRIGYIYLPEFYANFQDPNGPRCAADVAKEIVKLKAENVSGIILDLRNNGGGSLMDVVQMVGLFVEEGPVVQVKSRDEAPSVLRDRDNNVLWNGPLVVMVNEFSASASEIFAAAIQDYKRGLIVGSTSTYGKGTVQRNIELERTSWASNNPSDLGAVKLTLQKFYRITGASTQLKGVVSDIVLPDQYEYLKMREKDEPSALAWDEIPASQYKIWKNDFDFADVIKRSNARISQSNAFKQIKNYSTVLEKYNEKVYSLKLDKFRAEKQLLMNTVKAIDTLNNLPVPLSMTNLNSDIATIGQDSVKKERNKYFLRVRKNDLNLGETVNIINDMIQQYQIAANKLATKKEN
ncbi:MAG: carboxy terminal-processing peptidase [Chitinophagaceae bacterium]|nr:carboxy terminal-processing peptidase [Chitinophagaceae bacterium]